MGFGTLFFGYFLLLALPVQELTNVAAAAIMLYALYKLSFLNKNTKRAFYVCAVFLGFAFIETVLYVLSEFFGISHGSVAVGTAIYLVRTLIIGALGVLMLLGMRDTAEEVKLKKLAKKCDICAKITLVIYVFNLAFYPELAIFAEGDVPRKIFGACVAVGTLLVFFVIILNLTCIFGCYSGICMPEELEEKDEPKKSRFGFVNKFREHEERKSREYAEYKLDKKKKRREKKGK